MFKTLTARDLTSLKILGLRPRIFKLVKKLHAVCVCVTNALYLNEARKFQASDIQITFQKFQIYLQVVAVVRLFLFFSFQVYHTYS